MTRKRVAIIGYSSRLPGNRPAEFWNDLLQGKDLVTEVPADRWGQDPFLHPRKTHPGTSYTFAAGTIGDIAGFDADFFGISPREAAQMDPQQRILLELSWEALENAGVKPSSLRGSACGVFIGIASVDYSFRVVEDIASAESATATGTSNSIAANRISYALDLRGPSMAIDTACSSSLVAFHLACRSIISGESTHALTGGVSLHVHPYGFVTFSKATMLSPDGRCKVFDASGNGYVRSEGAALFLLKDYDAAVRDGDHIVAVVAGSAVNSDGRKSGITVPNVEAQVALLDQAYAEAGLSATEIDYVEAHGTGTAVGDPVETRALGIALGQQRESGKPLLIGSVKSNIGHLEAASGAAGLIKALHCIEHRAVPATIHLKTPNPNIRFDEWNLRVPTETTPLKPEGRLVIGVNSFGFGGANAHVILTSPEPHAGRESIAPEGVSVPVMISGKTPDALKQAAAEFAGFLRSDANEAPTYDLAWTSICRRDAHTHRAIIMVDDRSSLAASLKSIAADSVTLPHADCGSAIAGDGEVAFLYSGNGSQWEGMGRELFAQDAIFRKAVAAVDEVFIPLAGWSLVDEFSGKNGEDRYALTEIAQPALFALQVGITSMLREKGLNPSAVAGHSVGEVAAAWASGALSLHQATEVIYYRSGCQALTKGQGQMTAVGMGGNAASGLLEELGLSQSITIAGFNSGHAVTVAGPAAALEKFEQALSERKIFRKRLDLDYAFHSAEMDSIKAPVLDSLSALSPTPALLPFHSSVTGTILDGKALDADYWWRNIREPVRFEKAVESVIAKGVRIFIKIGAHPVLRSYVQQNLHDKGIHGAVIPTMQRNEGGAERIWRALRLAAIAGARIDWEKWFPVPGHLTPLPNYPWQRSRHWPAESPMSPGHLHRKKTHPLLGYRTDDTDWVWENELDTQSAPWLGDHIVGDTTVLPGTAYAEMALAAARQWQSERHTEIERLEIRAPLILNKNQSRHTRFSIDTSDGGFVIRSRDPLSGDEWTTHCTGRIVSGSSSIRLPLQAPQSPGETAEMSGTEHDLLTQAAGLSYGPAFRAISGIWQEGKSVCARLKLPECIRNDAGAMHLHPALLDCTFQLIIELLQPEAGTPAGTVYIPTRIEQLAWSGDATQPFTARATLLRRNPNTIVAGFALFDANGNPVASIREARFQKISIGKNQQERLSRLAYRNVPSPHPLSSGRAPRQLFDRVQKHVATAIGSTRSNRYATEVEPLLDIMCSRFATRPLRRLADDKGLLSGDTIQTLEQRQPELTHWLRYLIEILCEDNILRSDGTGWRFSAAEDLPAVEDIWNTLLQDYPQYLPVIHAVGRTGMHVGALLEGWKTPEQVLPGSCSPGTLSRQMLMESGLPAVQKALNHVIRQTADELSGGSKLGVLELCAEQPLFAPNLTGDFDFDRCGYTIGTISAALPESIHHIKDRCPSIDIRLINPLQPVEQKPVRLPNRFQLIIINPDFQTERETLFALAQARQWLAPRGVLILLEQHPSRWLDFVCGTRSEWWSCVTNGTHASRYKGAGFWRGHTERLGLTTSVAIEFTPDADVGPYFLIANAGDTETAKSPPSQAATAHHWLLLADRDTTEYSANLARQLSETLLKRGDKVSIATPAAHFRKLDGNHYQLDATNPDQFETLLAETSAWSPLEGIIHLQGMASTTGEHGSGLLSLEKQLDRCATATTIIKTCNNTGMRSGLWLLTAGVHPQRVPENQKSTTETMDAALWGFGRTAMNENAGSQIRMIDIDPATPLDAAGFLVARELSQPDAEQEIVFTFAGERMAPRLRYGLAPQRPSPSAPQPEVSRLIIDVPGQLRNLQWQATSLKSPADDEVEIEVAAAGLNFRDVMYSLGALSDDAVEGGFAGPALGLEFAGTVTRLGAEVQDFRIGDRVLGFGANSFSNRLVANAKSLALIPGGMPFAAAATIPSAFFTVHYALNRLARLEQGEKILIHGAAGGVGLAAIQIAKLCGAEIFATAGSREKRDFLRLLGVEHIFDSRSLAFADEILAATDGQGVDVILNSLAGEAINRNLRVLRPFGRFLELGKRDFQENTRIGLRPFRNNISYFAVDADQLMKERPELTAHLFSELMLMFREGTLHPLPYTEFSADEVVDAFRHMQQSRHIGKIVIDCRHVPEGTSNAAPVRQRLELPHDATYLVTGGLRGFGLKTAEWLADKGARHLLLLSRSGEITNEAEPVLKRLLDAGIEIRAAACDVTDRKALARILGDIGASMPPLRGIVHAAAVIEDAVIENLDRNRMRRVLAPKILGAKHLGELTRDRELDFLVFYSSATTLFGNPGQAAYVAANFWLEHYAQTLRNSGRRALSVGWGAIADSGYLARHRETAEALHKRMGGAPLSSAAALDVLETLLLSDQSGLGVLELEWPTLSRFLASSGSPKFSELKGGNDDKTSSDERLIDVRHLLETLSPAEATTTIGGMLKTEIGEILRIAPEKIDEHRLLHDLGFDSLMGVELATAVEARFTVRLPVMALNDAPTVAKLTSIIIERLSGNDQPGDAAPITEAQDLIEQGRKIAAQYAEGNYADAINRTAEEMQSGALKDTQRIIH